MTISPEDLVELLDQQWGPLVAWVGNCDGAAEDVVQQAFIALSAEPHPPSNPSAWLYKTSRNLAINERKQVTSRSRRHKLVARPESLSGDAWRTSEASELASKLAQLSNDQREVVVAHLWGGLSFDEIAHAIHCSRTTIWRRYNAGLRNLQVLYGVACEVKK